MSASHTITYRLSEADAVASSQFAVMRQFWNRPILRILVGLVVILYVVLVFVDRHAAFEPFLLALIIAVPLTFLLLVKLLAPWQAKRHYRQAAALRDEVVASWDEEGLSFSGARGNSRLAWNEYFRWAENRRVLLLYQSEMLYNVIPKSVLDDEALKDIRANLERAGVRKT